MSIYLDDKQKLESVDRSDERLLGPKLLEIDPESEAFKQIADYCYFSSWIAPYVTDFFHEKRRVMRGILKRDPNLLLTGLWKEKGKVLFDYSLRDKPQIKIIRIRKLLNIEVWNRYSTRRINEQRESEKFGPPKLPQMLTALSTTIETLSAPVINQFIGEVFLFSGHGTEVIKSIVKSGAKPYLGPYDPIKGYGALGKGAYFTDRIDKAITYSPCKDCGATSSPCLIFTGDKQKHRRRLLLNRVILGRPLMLETGESVRHSTHDELVKEKIKNVNETVDATSIEKPKESSHTSVIGIQTYNTGGSLLKALWYRNNFDSNEYLVRCGDQVYPAYVIYYTFLKEVRSKL